MLVLVLVLAADHYVTEADAGAKLLHSRGRLREAMPVVDDGFLLMIVGFFQCDFV